MTRAALRWGSVALFLSALWLALRVQSQDAPRASERLDLGRICVGEGGWSSTETGDCAAIAFVLQRRAELRGLSLRAMARAYSGRHLGTRASPRPWIAGLRLDGGMPRRWPASRRAWSRYRGRWLDVLEYAQDVLDGEVLDPCPGADHWGMRTGIDWERAQRAGWDLVECDLPTRNAFWHVPRGGDRGRM